jgi:hypothetical protein
MTSAAAVQAWIDKCALTELVAKLSAAVDRGDKEAVIDCYAEQSYDDHGAFKGSGPEFAEMICAPAGGPVNSLCITYSDSRCSTSRVMRPGVKRFSSCTP